MMEDLAVDLFDSSFDALAFLQEGITHHDIINHFSKRAIQVVSTCP